MNDQTPRLAWGHININVRDLDRSIEFYRKLGFEVFMPGIPYLGLAADERANRMPEASAQALGLPPETWGRACIMQLDGGFPKLDLTEFTNKTQRAPLTNGDLGIVRFCLATRNLQQDYARLCAQGVDFVSEPQAARDGLADIATCVDPDGALIELIQIDPEKWSSLGGED